LNLKLYAKVTTENEVKAVIEMPGTSKDKIKINAYDNTVEVRSEDPQRKYHRTFEIPPETDIETAKSTYNNGILEITFKKKEQTKTKGKTIKVE
jgi:HSP20 family protein